MGMFATEPPPPSSSDLIARERMPGRWTLYSGMVACGLGAFTLTCDSIYMSPCNGLALDTMGAITIISGIIALFYPTSRRQAAAGILLGIAALAVPYWVLGDDPSPRVTAARTAATRVVLLQVREGLDRFAKDNGRYPTQAEGLNALLVHPPGLVKTWRGPYLNPRLDGVRVSSVDDEWGRPLIYRMSGKERSASYDLSSCGRDGVVDTSDDIRLP